MAKKCVRKKRGKRGKMVCAKFSGAKRAKRRRR